jgi:hypothetical protein
MPLAVRSLGIDSVFRLLTPGQLVSAAKLISSPGGTAQSSSGLKPLVRITDPKSLNGQSIRPMKRMTCVAFTGLITLSVVVTWFQPGICCTVPSGLKRTFCDRN